uniref:BED-type domain-containing protein n=1 Tax=Globodera pallida TaxID=36090 RepID=A0A183C1G3_GLOPA
MKGTGVNPIGSSLFGQQNTLGQQQQGGLFGKPAATTSAPTFPSATTASSLFGGQPQTGGLFGAAKPAGSSLFGAATSQPSGGLFGQQQQQPSSAFGLLRIDYACFYQFGAEAISCRHCFYRRSVETPGKPTNALRSHLKKYHLEVLEEY